MEDEGSETQSDHLDLMTWSLRFKLPDEDRSRPRSGASLPLRSAGLETRTTIRTRLDPVNDPDAATKSIVSSCARWRAEVGGSDKLGPGVSRMESRVNRACLLIRLSTWPGDRRQKSSPIASHPADRAVNGRCRAFGKFQKERLEARDASTGASCPPRALPR